MTRRLAVGAVQTAVDHLRGSDWKPRIFLMRAAVSAFFRSVAEQDGPLDLRGDGAGADESGLLRERGGGGDWCHLRTRFQDTYRAMVDPPPGPSDPGPEHPPQRFSRPEAGIVTQGVKRRVSDWRSAIWNTIAPRIEQGKSPSSWVGISRGPEITPSEQTR